MENENGLFVTNDESVKLVKPITYIIDFNNVKTVEDVIAVLKIIDVRITRYSAPITDPEFVKVLKRVDS